MGMPAVVGGALVQAQTLVEKNHLYVTIKTRVENVKKPKKNGSYLVTKNVFNTYVFHW